METLAINLKELYYTPTILVRSDGNGVMWVDLAPAATIDEAFQRAAHYMEEREFYDINTGRTRIVFAAKISLRKGEDEEAVIMKQWDVEGLTDYPTDVTSEERKFIELFPTVNEDAPYYSHVYDVAISGEMIRVNADCMSDAIDFAVDHAEEEGLEGLFMDEETVNDYYKNGWEGEILYAGNHGRPLCSSDVFCFQVTGKDE